MGYGLIAGVGVGVVIIFVVWMIAILLCCIVPHEHGRFTWPGILSTLFAIIITITLISLPRSPEFEVEKKPELTVYDEPFSYRVILVIVMGITFLVSLFLMISTQWNTQIRAKTSKTL